MHEILSKSMRQMQKDMRNMLSDEDIGNLNAWSDSQ